MLRSMIYQSQYELDLLYQTTLIFYRSHILSRTFWQAIDQLAKLVQIRSPMELDGRYPLGQ